MKYEEKPKICHICSYYENILFDNLVIEQMDITNPVVFFFKPNGSKKIYKKEYVNEINCFPKWSRIFFFLKEHYVNNVYDVFMNNIGDNIELNFAHSLFVNGYIAYKAKISKGIPYIVMVQNTDINVFFKYRKHLNKIGLKILQNAERIVFASTSYIQTLTERYISVSFESEIKSKSVVIPYGIENFFFDNQLYKKALTDNIKILSVGLICKNKNHVRLAKAVAVLRKKGLNITLDIVGKANDKNIIRHLKTYSFVRIYPYEEKINLLSKYKNSDIFALTSITETFGLVYAEALSQGLPVIYSKGQGFDGQFPDEYVGYGVNAMDELDIAKGILKVITNYSNLAENTLKASKKFKWEHVNLLYKEMYKSIFRISS